MSPRSPTIAGLLVATILATVPSASADTVHDTLTLVCVVAQYDVVCGEMTDLGLTYDCVVIAPQYGLGAASLFLAHVNELYPMIKETKCKVLAGADANARWFNDAWLRSVRPWFCFTMGYSPSACPTTQSGVFTNLLVWEACQGAPPSWTGLLPQPKVCAPPTVPAPPTVTVPPPPWPLGNP